METCTHNEPVCDPAILFGIFHTLCTWLEILAISLLLYFDINNSWHPFAIYKKSKHSDSCKCYIYVLLLNLKISWGFWKEFNLSSEVKPKGVFHWKDATSGPRLKHRCLHRWKSQGCPGGQPLHSHEHRHHLKRGNIFKERRLRNTLLECSKSEPFVNVLTGGCTRNFMLPKILAIHVLQRIIIS